MEVIVKVDHPKYVESSDSIGYFHPDYTEYQIKNQLEFIISNKKLNIRLAKEVQKQKQLQETREKFKHTLEERRIKSNNQIQHK